MPQQPWSQVEDDKMIAILQLVEDAPLKDVDKIYSAAAKLLTSAGYCTNRTPEAIVQHFHYLHRELYELPQQPYRAAQ
jgi:hypothetical protein